MSGMDFRSAGARVRSLVAKKKPAQLSDSALTPDDLRDNIIAEEIDHTPRFQASANSVPEVEYDAPVEGGEEGETERKTYEWSTFSDMLRDYARAGFGYDKPEIRKPDQMRPSHLFNHAVAAEAFNHQEFEEAYPYMRGNPLESMWGAMGASERLHEHAQEVAEHLARSEEMREQEEAITDAQTAIDNLRQMAQQQQQAGDPIDPNIAQQMRQQVQTRQQAKQQLGQLLQQHLQSNYRQAAAKIGAQAANAIKEAVQVVSALPGTEPGSARQLPTDRQLEIAEKWSADENLKKMVQLFGRLIKDFRFKREARTKGVPVEPVSIKTGRDIQHLVPHEFARAYMPEFLPLFMKDFAESKLLEWEMRGKTRAGKGPIIGCHDGSGSMGMDFGGVPRWVWASAIELLMLQQSIKEKRAFAGVEFGYGASELASWFFPARETPDPDKVLEFAGHFFGGGTDITVGMGECLRIIREQPDFKSADIVLMSDGEDRFQADDKAIRDELRALNVRIHGISIGSADNVYLEQMCDVWLDVAQLADSERVMDSLAENLT